MLALVVVVVVIIIIFRWVQIIDTEVLGTRLQTSILLCGCLSVEYL